MDSDSRNHLQRFYWLVLFKSVFFRWHWLWICIATLPRRHDSHYSWQVLCSPRELRMVNWKILLSPCSLTAWILNIRVPRSAISPNLLYKTRVRSESCIFRRFKHCICERYNVTVSTHFGDIFGIHYQHPARYHCSVLHGIPLLPQTEAKATHGSHQQTSQ
jgi:hypothetical protein